MKIQVISLILCKVMAVSLIPEDEEKSLVGNLESNGWEIENLVDSGKNFEIKAKKEDKNYKAKYEESLQRSPNGYSHSFSTSEASITD